MTLELELTCKTYTVWLYLREAVMFGHTLEEVDELLVVQAERHLALKLALALVRPPVTASHALIKYIMQP